ncbi:MAG: DUF721 domain-containing protein [Nitrospirota bacterium]|nr:DUF721 domain-containing protein [Nitrospirota bacterium]
MKKTGAVLDSLLKSLGLESGVRLARIKQDWYNLFDHQITAHLFPVSFSDGELLFHVSSPIWMQQFSYHKSEIIKKLSTYGVKKIRFRLGRVPQKKQETPPSGKASELTSENRLFVADLLTDIHDENLKDAIKTAVEKSLTSGKPLRSD